MQKLFLYSSSFPIIFLFLISFIIIPSIIYEYNSQGINVELVSYGVTSSQSIILDSSSTSFKWPTPGYNYITSDFGYRNNPITGVRSYHGGIDIGAAEGSKILSIADGVVLSAGWGGANGYTVTIDHLNGYKSIYGHVNPNFVVHAGEKVLKGQVIAYVGPKYVEQKTYTNYKDSSRQMYKWFNNWSASTSCSHKRWHKN